MKKRLDLLLVNPGDRKRTYQSLGSELAGIEPPIWAGLISSFIEKKGFSIDILDSNAENIAPDETAKKVIETNPILTAIVVYGHNPSASTTVMPSTGAICKAIKQENPTQKILLVGGHVASLPEQTLQEEEADFVCSGEGPYTVLDLLNLLKSGSSNGYDKVRDLWYREEDGIKHNPPAPLVQDLDQEMPGMTWDLLPMEKYRAHNWHCFEGLQRQPYAALYTTLGCPYHCSYCCIQAPFRTGEKALGYKSGLNSYRLWSPESIIAQIDHLVNKYGVRNIKFADELFVMNPGHVNKICDLIIERGYDLNIWAYARVDTVKDRMIEKLKKAGIDWLAFGVEAGSERVRNDVNKKIDQDKIFKIIEKVRQAGIYVIGNYIFGLPEDDLETMQATLDLAMDLNCEFANIYCAMAYPGSDLYRVAYEKKMPLPETWNGYSQYSFDTLPLPTKYISGAEVLSFRDHAFHTYFSNPKYLDMITQKFGIETADHIREMASTRLKRKYAVEIRNMPEVAKEVFQ